MPRPPGRLRASRDVAAALAARRRVGADVALHVRRTEGPVRLAFVASRKVGGAVERNRAKRLLREAARHVAWAPGQDVVVVARRGALERRPDELAGQLRDLADQLGALARS